MSIEFRCTQCSKLLRTGDETAGKQAKCPQCGAVMTIPAAGSAAPPPLAPLGADPQPAGSAGSANPYQSPAPFVPRDTSQSPGTITPTVLDPSDIFNRTWNIFKEQWGMCVVGYLVALLLNLVLLYGPILVGLPVGRMVFGHQIAMVFYHTGSIVGGLVSVWLNIGAAIYFLKIARGQMPDLSDLFSGGPYYVNILLAHLLVSLIVGVGILLFIVPGVILALMFSQSYYLIFDRNVPVLDSLNQSKELTTGNKMTLLLIWLIASAVGSLLILFSCGLGVFVVGPYLVLLVPVIYLTITGQPTADQLK